MRWASCIKLIVRYHHAEVPMRVAELGVVNLSWNSFICKERRTLVKGCAYINNANVMWCVTETLAKDLFLVFDSSSLFVPKDSWYMSCIHYSDHARGCLTMPHCCDDLR